MSLHEIQGLSFDDSMDLKYKYNKHIVEPFIDKFKMPEFNFKKKWKVKFLPAFDGAIVRFVVKNKKNNKYVSVYLDAYQYLGLGCHTDKSTPYWEVYSPDLGDCQRFKFHETDTYDLVSYIDWCITENIIN